MTLGEALKEVYSTTDEQDDLSPYDADMNLDETVAGAVRLLQAFEMAAATIAFWRFPNGYRVRFRVLEDEEYVTTPYLTSDVVGYDGGRGVQLSEAHNLLDTAGAHITFTSQDGTETFETIVSRWTNGALYPVQVASAPTLTDMTTATYVIRSSIYRYVPLTNLSVVPAFTMARKPIEWLSFYDVDGQVELERGGYNEKYPLERMIAQDPTAWVHSGNSVIFNGAPDEKTYLARYVRMPVVGTEAADDLCDLPEQFHDAVVQWTRHWAFSRGGDIVASRDAWQKLDKLMATLRSQFDIETDYGESRLEMLRY